ncbi:MAG TPA: hypothetical protein VN690_07965 [Terriglobales bacterium]|nr:hypothetical protein [Terriglobales bacterium]
MGLSSRLAFASWLVASVWLVAQGPPLPFAVELKATQTVSSADAVVGQIVLFTTVKPFAAGGQEFGAGTTAAGRIIESKSGGRMARGGVLKISLEEIQLEDGRTFPLSGVAVFHGGSRDAGLAGGAVAAGLLVTPYASPAALLLRGKAAVMPAGALVAASFGAASSPKPNPGSKAATAAANPVSKPQGTPH